MSTDKDDKSTDREEGEKNKEKISCRYCPSKILNPGMGTFQKIEFSLPHVHHKGEGEGENDESLSEYWLVEDVYTFENIGVSRTVGNLKYLACADCERGPIGWHELSTKKSYIALSRVKHE